MQSSEPSPAPDSQGSVRRDVRELDVGALLERVCSRLPSEMSRRLVRDVARMKLQQGLEQEVREYLLRKCDHAADLIVDSTDPDKRVR